MVARHGEAISWPPASTQRRRLALLSGIAIHAALLHALLAARLGVPVPASAATVWTTLLPIPRRPHVDPPPERSAPARAPRPVVGFAMRLPIDTAHALIAQSPASGASAPLPDAAADTALRLELRRDQLRALEADTRQTLAQRLAPPPPMSALAQHMAPTPQFEEDDRNGIHTVRSHGGCYILVPSGQSKADPFNHGGERLTGRATNDNC